MNRLKYIEILTSCFLAIAAGCSSKNHEHGLDAQGTSNCPVLRIGMAKETARWNIQTRFGRPGSFLALAPPSDPNLYEEEYLIGTNAVLVLTCRRGNGSNIVTSIWLDWSHGSYGPGMATNELNLDEIALSEWHRIHKPQE